MVIFLRNHLPTTNKNHLMPHAVGFLGRGNVEPESIGSALEPFSAWADRKWNDNEWTNGTNEFFTEDKNPFCLGIFGISATKNQHRSTFPFPQLKVQCCKEKDPKNCYIMSLTVLHMAPNTTKTRDRLMGWWKNARIHVDWLQFRRCKRHRRSICRLCLGGLMTSLPLDIFHWLPQEELKLVREGLRACLQLLLQNFLQKEAGLDIESRTHCVSWWFCFEMVRSFITTVTAHLQRQAKPSPGDTRSKSFSAEGTIMNESAFGCIWQCV